MRKHNDGCTCVKHGWEWDVVRNQCVCDLCAGGCCETNPSCYDCFLCEEKADDDHWWEVNKADLLQV